ncbi:hypothetical protein WN51_07123 [Melipona quadrifasciata]|uniref:Uncharacterized protein n=1 Tax=Melipona quadrifasciata TaxID=166423 RepID=A0A0M8ZS10_9HYME|nr:hypothetical protein WN51_07123 [Melipona quadrifasciata]
MEMFKLPALKIKIKRNERAAQLHAAALIATNLSPPSARQQAEALKTNTHACTVFRILKQGRSIHECCTIVHFATEVDVFSGFPSTFP